MELSRELANSAVHYLVTELCLNHTLKTLEHIFKLSPWALGMLDSTSKIPESILTGNVIDFGNYEECLAIDVHEEWGSFIGRHCVAMFMMPTKMLPNDGVSAKLKRFPAMFSDVKPIVQERIVWFQKFHLVGRFACPLPAALWTCKLRCQDSARTLLSIHYFATPKNKPPFRLIDLLALAFFGLVALQCFLSAIYDLLVTDKKRRSKLIVAFSWYSNWKNLMSTKSGTESLDALHGLRFLSIAWIVLGHVYLLSAVQPAVNLIPYMHYAAGWSHVVIANTFFAVDTFFVLSGMLVCYTFLKTMAKGTPFNLPYFYLHRFLRVTPVLGAVVLMHSSFLPRVVDGPLWDNVMAKTDSGYCEKYWWSTLLYVQNYVNVKEMCVLTSWFLAVDMQLFWISPLFLLTLHKRPRIGLALILIAILAGMAVSFEESYVHEDDPNFAHPGLSFNDRYHQTHMRCVPWFIGLGCGYLIHRTTEWRAGVAAGTQGLSKVTVVCGWILVTVITIGTGICIFPFEQDNYIYDAVEAASYYAFTRPIWSLCLVWIIFACVSGYGGPVNTILSFRIFRPLSRLAFCMYLAHFDIVVARIYSTSVPKYLSDFDKVSEFFEDLVLTILMAIFLSLTIEAPAIGLEKALFQKGTKKSPEHNVISLQDVGTRYRSSPMAASMATSMTENH